MIGERVSPVRRKKLCQLTALLSGKARTNTHMLQRAPIIKEAEQQRAYRALAGLVPAKAGNHTVAITLVLDFEHDTLIRLIGSTSWLGNYSVETRALKATKPVGRYTRFGGCRG